MESVMKTIINMYLLGVCAISTGISAHASQNDKLVYINPNLGFNVEGYNYQQPALPCDVDKKLVDLVIKKGGKVNLQIETAETTEKIKNGTVPVVLIDIEELALSKEHTYGDESNYLLPKIKITAGLLKGKDLQTAKHTCAVAPSDNVAVLSTDIVKYDHPGVNICTEVQKCLEGLSGDVVEWLKPQIK